MKFFTQWFGSLKRPNRHQKSTLEYMAKVPYHFGSGPEGELKTQQHLIEKLNRRFEYMLMLLQKALTERRTATQEDLDVALAELLGAAEAEAHRKLTGASAESEMGRIVRQNLFDTTMKMRVLMCEDINKTPEDMAAIVAEYELKYPMPEITNEE